jgi:NosR/NirI family nitrous oxide reductase transcriptional regulator
LIFGNFFPNGHFYNRSTLVRYLLMDAMNKPSLLIFLALTIFGFFWKSPAYSAAYEAPLPPELHDSPNMCAFAPCKEVIPGADSFSERKGHPSYTEAYRHENGKNILIGYVFLSTDIVDIPAYSGKPVVTLIGMDTKGIFTGARVLKHSEPILLLGIPESALIDFIHQYVGKFVGDKLEIGGGEGGNRLDAISGATVTVIAQNQVMLRAAAGVAKQVGILQPKVRAPAKYVQISGAPDWDALVAEGGVQRLTISSADVGRPPSSQPYIDLWFGELNSPGVGKAVLGEANYARLMEQLKPSEHAIFIIGSGIESFKGSGFVRGGIYDRLQISQDGDTFTFRDTDYLNLYGVLAKGAPQYTESGIFIVRNTAFSGAYPWSLAFLGNRVDQETGAKTFASFEKEYWLPARYLEGGRPVVTRPEPTWLKVWRDKLVEIALFVALLAFVATAYACRDSLTRRATHKNKWPVNVFKYAGWGASIGFVGFHAMAQPSITQVLTWFHSLIYQWKWELFLSDPFIFIFWLFIIVTVFVWGRGLFCGWLCPFGSLSEAIYKFGELIGLKRFQKKLPMRWHNRLKWIKYGVFWGLLGISFFSMGLAERLAEVEPFKTTFLVGLFNRAWPYTLFAGGLLGISLFVERPFCKYLCPLGAALAMPTTFRWFGLRRKAECSSCTACARGCGSLAIDEKGRIDQRECLLCLDCMVLYHDDHACPPLAQERKRRTKAGLPLTPIGKDGYFIPIQPVDDRKGS